MSDKNVLLRVKNLTRAFKIGRTEIKAVNSANFDVHKGDFIFIVGPSGSGKTTLVNMLVGLDRPTEGEIYMKLNGHGYNNIVTYSRKQYEAFRRFNVSIIFQFFNLIPILTAKENVELTAELMDYPDPAAKAVEILDKLGLHDQINKYPHQMSGGDQQRVAIARALVKQTPIIFADEPTGNLDFAQGMKILEFMQSLNREFEVAFIIVSHNKELAEKYGKGQILIRDGVISQLA